MRQLLVFFAVIPLMGCEPSAAREAPINIKPGLYLFQLPSFIPAKLVKQDGYCVNNGAQDVLPKLLTQLPFEALNCPVQEPTRKGNYLTIAGACKPPEDIAGGTMAIEGNATVENEAIYGSFKIDMTNVEKNTTDAKKAALLTALVRFKFQANRIGDC